MQDAIAATGQMGHDRVAEMDSSDPAAASARPMTVLRPTRALRHVKSGSFVRGEVSTVFAEDGVAAAWLQLVNGGAIVLCTGDGGDWRISWMPPGLSYVTANRSVGGPEATFNTGWLRGGGRMTLRPSGRTLRLAPRWGKWQLVETRHTTLATLRRTKRNGAFEFNVSDEFAGTAELELALPFALWLASEFERRDPGEMPSR